MTTRLTDFGYRQTAWTWQPSAIGDVLTHTCHPHYTIPRTQFKTPADLVRWILLLSEKRWITKSDLAVIIERFVERNQAEFEQDIQRELDNRKLASVARGKEFRERLMRTKPACAMCDGPIDPLDPAHRIEKGTICLSCFKTLRGQK